MRHAFIDEVEVDQDVCYGEFDSHITTVAHEVVMFENNIQIDRRLLCSYKDAIALAERFVDHGLEPINL